MDFLTFDFNELKKELFESARNQGIKTKEEFIDLIDNLVQEKINFGEIDEDVDVKSLKEKLEYTWEEYESSLYS